MNILIASIKGIKFKNLPVWIKHQLNLDGWVKRLFIKRSAWGAFSVYSHIKRSNGKPKNAYSTKSKAENAAVDMAKKYGKSFTVYKCLFCDGWHVSQDAHGVPVQEKSAEAMALEINQVIDLRADYTSDFYNELCRKSGIAYFHYSVSYEEVEQMARLFPEFCRLIDNGRFYIACAMGLHRTDIALCTYWVFYAADKGIAPPAIRGYRRVDGHTTSKIMRILNALYKYWTLQNGKEPMPIEVFRERKEIINELSKK